RWCSMLSIVHKAIIVEKRPQYRCWHRLRRERSLVTDPACRSQPAVRDMDDFVAGVLGPENTERVVDRANDIASRGALIFIEEDTPVVGIVDELLSNEIQVVGKNHRFVF